MDGNFSINGAPAFRLLNQTPIPLPVPQQAGRAATSLLSQNPNRLSFSKTGGDNSTPKPGSEEYSCSTM